MLSSIRGFTAGSPTTVAKCARILGRKSSPAVPAASAEPHSVPPVRIESVGFSDVRTVKQSPVSAGRASFAEDCCMALRELVPGQVPRNETDSRALIGQFKVACRCTYGFTAGMGCCDVLTGDHNRVLCQLVSRCGGDMSLERSPAKWIGEGSEEEGRIR